MLLRTPLDACRCEVAGGQRTQSLILFPMNGRNRFFLYTSSFASDCIRSHSRNATARAVRCTIKNCTRDVSTEDSGKRRGRGWGGGRVRDESSTSLERSVRGVAETKIGNRVRGIIVRVGEGAGGAERYGPH